MQFKVGDRVKLIKGMQQNRVNYSRMLETDVLTIAAIDGKIFWSREDGPEWDFVSRYFEYAHILPKNYKGVADGLLVMASQQ